ncbi:nucleotidyltransferase domain-containing protein [Actinoplanes solisilvae]|uniref:nucleotidyltransferase domain-containing protein n=1 Tax=Actinoplanes solisilvae TaxID=2486853 RepID=UPI000FD8055D|nr:nucleotidyltransferase [Actinoplanes solisilvae]
MIALQGDPDRLAEWAEPPGEFMLSWTEEVLRDALTYARRLRERPYEIFLQGSYANGTNIGQTSDVDLVVMLQLPFEEDVEALDAAGRNNFERRYEEDFYGWEDFRQDVLSALRESHFVDPGYKCVGIRDWDSLLRVPADILPALEFRRYSDFPTPVTEVYHQGVFFRDGDGRSITNFPKQHRVNGNDKDFRTGRRFKQVVRVAKHLRGLAKEQGLLDGITAPSYLIECLLYNVPDEVYRAALPDAAGGALDWLAHCCRTDPEAFAALPCQNELNDLFGDGPDQLDTVNAGRFLATLPRVRPDVG